MNSTEDRMRVTEDMVCDERTCLCVSVPTRHSMRHTSYLSVCDRLRGSQAAMFVWLVVHAVWGDVSGVKSLELALH